MMGKYSLPAIQLYVGDWLRDSISSCSLEAQGLWLRMMFLMHDSERYGYLQMLGKPMSDEMIAAKCGCGIDEFNRYLCELFSVGVPSKTRDNILYSRRMVRDARRRKQTAIRVRNHRNNHKLNGHISNAHVTQDVTQMKHRASSSSSVAVSSSTSSSKQQQHTRPTADDVSKYAETISYKLDGQSFVDHYEANGWMVGKVPMKNWQAAVRKWKTNQNNGGVTYGRNAVGTSAGEAAPRPGKYTD